MHQMIDIVVRTRVRLTASCLVSGHDPDTYPQLVSSVLRDAQASAGNTRCHLYLDGKLLPRTKFLAQVWRHPAAVCNMEADPQPTLAFFLTCSWSAHKSIIHLPDAASLIGASAVFRAAANEFGSFSRSIWHTQDQADLTQIMAANPTENLPCSM